LVLGGLLWGIAVVALALTSDPYIVPTVVILGSFVVPIAWVVRVSDRNRPAETTSQLLGIAFVGGGTLGFLSSALLETPFISAQRAVFTVCVGVIEEASKMLALAWISRRIPGRSPAGGFVLGAAVGFGFEAFEDAGYALRAFAGGHSWSSLVGTELTRAATAPIAHGLWTAILGAILFHQGGHGRFRVTLPLVLGFAAVAGLHAVWDLIPNIGLGIDLHLFGGSRSSMILPQSLPAGATATVKVFNHVLDDAGLALVGLIGLLAAHGVRRRLHIGHRTGRPDQNREVTDIC
jgi:RsiW-degrading membrane proteinase PrsW (M82 family)